MSQLIDESINQPTAQSSELSIKSTDQSIDRATNQSELVKVRPTSSQPSSKTSFNKICLKNSTQTTVMNAEISYANDSRGLRGDCSWCNYHMQMTTSFPDN